MGAAVASVQLNAEPQSVRQARSFVTREMSAAGVSSGLAVLLTSELASNVVQHAKTSFELMVVVTEGVVHVELHDGKSIDAAFRELIEQHPGAPSANVISGRGLMLMTTGAMSCGLIDKGEHGKAVWFDVPTDHADD